MKKTLLFNTLLLGSSLAGSTWSHHAAEGIVSDEIWQMIDANLQAVESPHLGIDFTDILGSMSVFEGDDGDLYLTSSAPAYPLEPGAVGYAKAKLQAEELAARALADSNQIPSGKTDSGNASVAWYDILEPGNNVLEIVLFEPIGSGNSQTGENPGNGPADEIPGDSNSGEEQGGKRAEDDPGNGDPGGNPGKGG